MKYFKTILLIVILFFIQIAIVPNISIKGAFPNILLVAMIILILNFDFADALVWAVAGGVLLDLYSPIYFGVYTLSFLVIFAINYFILNKFISNPIFPIVFFSFFIGYLLVELVPFLILTRSWPIYLLSATYTAILGTICYYLSQDKFHKTESSYKLSERL